MPPRLTVQAQTSFHGLTPSGLARVDVEFPGHQCHKLRLERRPDAQELHRAALLDVIGEGFNIRTLREVTGGFVFQISVPNKEQK